MYNDRSSDRLLSGPLGSYFAGGATLLEALTEVAESVLAEVPSAAMAGISMEVDGRLGTHVFSDPVVVEIDDVQFRAGEGPSLVAFNDGVLSLISSVAASHDFAAFCAAASERNVRSVLTTPLDNGRQVVGVLSLCASSPYVFETRDLHAARRSAADTAFILLSHPEPMDTDALSQTLQESTDARASVEQAKGVIVAATGCSPDDALERLRAQAVGSDPLHVAAERLLGRVRTRHPEPGGVWAGDVTWSTG